MHICPVCWYDQLEEPPRNRMICPGCGTHFDYFDVWRCHLELRHMWQEAGSVWWAADSERKPAVWPPRKPTGTAWRALLAEERAHYARLYARDDTVFP